VTVSKSKDIVIAGGGMVGVSLALQLDAVLPPATSICLIEGFALPPAVPEEGRPDYHPSFDARSTALSYSSRLIYEEIGVWNELQQWLCPIETIHVSSRGNFGSTLLRAADYDWPALGYVVENAWMGGALVQALHRRPRVELLSPDKVVAATPVTGGVCLELEKNAVMETSLLVIADGAASGLREHLGVAVEEKSYGQHALIANIATAQPHQGCAFERFTDEGPLALLPLVPSAAGENRSALVWSLAPQQAQHLHQCPEHEFLAELKNRFGYRLGRMLEVGERHSYPLSLVYSREQVRQGIVVMGNAAHALHPVAGQGFNLALRDIASLAAALAEGLEEGRSPGDLAPLLVYQRRQQADQERTIQFSDRLPGLFMHSDPVLGVAREIGLSGLDVLAPLKKQFVRYAAGVADIRGSAGG
jgi:2-octaprenyl-6-methoxyphenol hydroxylase